MKMDLIRDEADYRKTGLRLQAIINHKGVSDDAKLIITGIVDACAGDDPDFDPADRLGETLPVIMGRRSPEFAEAMYISLVAAMGQIDDDIRSEIEQNLEPKPVPLSDEDFQKIRIKLLNRESNRKVNRVSSLELANSIFWISSVLGNEDISEAIRNPIIDILLHAGTEAQVCFTDPEFIDIFLRVLAEQLDPMYKAGIFDAVSAAMLQVPPEIQNAIATECRAQKHSDLMRADYEEFGYLMAEIFEDSTVEFRNHAGQLFNDLYNESPKKGSITIEDADFSPAYFAQLFESWRGVQARDAGSQELDNQETIKAAA